MKMHHLDKEKVEAVMQKVKEKYYGHRRLAGQWDNILLN